MRRVVLWGGRAGDVQFGSPADRRQEAIRRQRAVWIQFSARWAKAMAELNEAALTMATITAKAITTGVFREEAL